MTLLWDLRKELNSVVCAGDHPDGKKLLRRFYTVPGAALLPDEEWDAMSPTDQLVNANVWSCLVRRDYIFGNLRRVVEELKDRRLRMQVIIPGEVAYLRALVAYHNSAYENSEGFIAGALRENTAPEPYLAARFHLVLAKCAYRDDDFPSALRHLGLSSWYNVRFHEEDGQGAGFADYLKVRIQTVAVRLLADRKGRDHDATANVDKARDYLRLAKRYLLNECKVSPYAPEAGNGGHPYLAELLELRALILRSEANLEVRHNFNKAIKKLEASDGSIQRALSMLGGLFPEENTRRQAHAKRILGYNQIIKLLLYRRWGQTGYNRKKLMDKAEECFTKEVDIRIAANLKSPHATIARVRNHLAFVHVFRGHGIMNDPSDLNPEEKRMLSEPHFTAAISQLSLALKGNGFAGGIASLDTLTLDKINRRVKSRTEFFHTVNLYMEARLRLEGPLNKDSGLKLFDLMWRLARLTMELEWSMNLSRSSREAREDISRQTRPIYEVMIEVCHMTSSIAAIDPQEWEKAVFQVFEIAVGAGMANEDSALTKTSELPQAVYQNAQDWISSITEGARPYPEKPKTYDDGESRRSGADTETSPSPYVGVEAFISKFTGLPGSITVYFMGRRHIYALHFAGDGHQILRAPRLLRITNLPYEGISSTRSLQLRYLRMARKAKATREFRKAKETSGPERDQLLHELWKHLVEPVNLTRAEDEVERHYIIPDQWLWGVHWAALVTKIIGDDVASYLFQDNVSQHAALLLWDRLVNGQDLSEAERLAMETEMLGFFMYTVSPLHPKNPHSADDTCLQLSSLLINNEIRKVTHGKENVTYDLLNEDWGSCSERIVQETNKQLFLDQMEQANLIVINAHKITDKGIYLLGISLNEYPERKLVLTQMDIESLDLHKCQLVMLLCCKGGEGPTRTGQLPLSLSSSFLKARAPAIVYCNEVLHYQVAEEYAVAFLKESLRNSAMIDCHRSGLQAVLNMSGEMEHLSDSSQWGPIYFLGDQQLCLFGPGFCSSSEV